MSLTVSATNQHTHHCSVLTFGVTHNTWRFFKIKKILGKMSINLLIRSALLNAFVFSPPDVEVLEYLQGPCFCCKVDREDVICCQRMSLGSLMHRST